MGCACETVAGSTMELAAASFLSVSAADVFGKRCSSSRVRLAASCVLPDSCRQRMLSRIDSADRASSVGIMNGSHRKARDALS